MRFQLSFQGNKLFYQLKGFLLAPTARPKTEDLASQNSEVFARNWSRFDISKS